MFLLHINPETDITEILKTVGEPGPTMLNVVDDDKLIGIITKADLLHLVKSENKIKEIMQENIFSVSPDDRIIHARRIMIDNNIARLPVIDKGNLLGMIEICKNRSFSLFDRLFGVWLVCFFISLLK